MNNVILVGFPLLIAIDTASQVCIRIIGNRVSQFEFGTAWTERTINESLLYLVVVFFGAAFAVYLMLLKNSPVGPMYAAAHLQSSCSSPSVCRAPTLRPLPRYR